MKQIIGILLIYVGYVEWKKRQLPTGGANPNFNENATTVPFEEAEVIEEITVELV